MTRYWRLGLHYRIPRGNLRRGSGTMNSLSTAQSEHRYFSFVAVSVTVTVLAGFIPLYTSRNRKLGSVSGKCVYQLLE